MSTELARSPSSADPLLAAWLWTLAALVFAMISKFTCLRTLRLAARHPCRPRRSLATAAAPNRAAADFIRIVEVGPRDGLQNEKTSIPVATKIDLVERLAQTGLQTIEAGSFVSPKWTPQVGGQSLRCCKLMLM